jgi:hypothetical protein
MPSPISQRAELLKRQMIKAKRFLLRNPRAVINPVEQIIQRSIVNHPSILQQRTQVFKQIRGGDDLFPKSRFRLSSATNLVI